MGYVYKITNTVNQKSYIGISIHNPEKRRGRITDHLAGRGNRILAYAVKKYGRSAFIYEILEANVFPELLSDLEKAYIKKFGTVAPSGYNLTHGGEKNKVPSDETRRKQSKAHKGRKQSEETIRKRTETLRRNPPMLGKTHSEATRRKLSEIGKINPASIEARKKGTRIAAKKNRGRKRPSETCKKMSIASRKSDYTEMHDFFLSLPTGMHLSEKTCLLREKFPDVKHSTFYFRMRKWTGIKGKKQHPDYPEVHQFFISLPADIPLPKKRHLLHKEFPNVSRKLINRWLNKWSGTKTLIRHPDKVPARELFSSLPSDMLLSEKRRLLYKQFPNVKRNTMNKWTLNWQSELTAKGEQK